MKFFKYFKKIKLTKEEKEKSLDFLLARTGLVRNNINYRHNIEKVPFLQLVLNHKNMFVGLLVAAILAMGGGTAVAAENTVPGDLLYPIKTQITEEIRSALAISPEAQVAWDEKRAERRLQEAEKLASEDKLTTSTSEMLATKFTEFSNRATARLQKLEDSGKLTPEQIQSLKDNFEVAVKAHDEIISRIEAKQQVKEQIKTVRNSLREQASSTIKDRLEYELELIEEGTTTTLKTVADNRKNAANNKISEVEKFINNNTSKVSTENVKESTNKLNEAKVFITEGDSLLSEENYGEAVIKYSEAHRKAQEAQLYMTTRFKLERKLEATTSTPAVFASGTLQFENEKKQEIWDQHESLKAMEQKLKEEVKQAREIFDETKKEAMEKIKEVSGSKIGERKLENRGEKVEESEVDDSDEDIEDNETEEEDQDIEDIVDED